MASAPTFQSNPYSSFDPSQWTNPYSQYQSSALPFPLSYVGWPTNALGQPIQPQLQAQMAAQPQAAPAAAPAMGTSLNSSAMTAAQQQAMAQNMRVQPTDGTFGWNAGYASPVMNLPPVQAAAPQAAAPQAAAPRANAAGLTPQQYMALIANPGPVATPGATVPQAGSPSPMGPGVLQQFLANWHPTSTGPGSGFQQGFARALKGNG
jgi:hypothetical protein